VTSGERGSALKAAASLGIGQKPSGSSRTRRASLENDQAERSDNSPMIRPLRARSELRRDSTKSGGDPHNLRRFTSEQTSVFRQALSEINAGQKRSCWMWFVIPTPPFIVNGVERGSPTNKLYSIRTREEGLAFLTFTADNVNLRENYVAIIGAVEAQLKKGANPVKLMGSLDAPKLRSSVEYFAEVAQGIDEEMSKVCKSVVQLLDKSAASGTSAK
jgi:uncharacterized protein (DUF1810 family)